jgi:hypothetical protein
VISKRSLYNILEAFAADAEFTQRVRNSKASVESVQFIREIDGLGEAHCRFQSVKLIAHMGRVEAGRLPRRSRRSSEWR